MISDGCDELLSDLDAGYTELIFVMKNDERGGYLPGASIAYTTDDGRYVLDIDWAMISCGSAIPEVDGDDLCAPL